MSKLKLGYRRDFDSNLPISQSVMVEVKARLETARMGFPPTHQLCGNKSERAGRGDPGHCEACAVVGHVRAHPEYGCGDVHCNFNH